MSTFEVTSAGPLRGSFRVPGDKSISHRALLFAALAEGSSRISGISGGDDVRRTRLALAAMGAAITKDGDDWLVSGGRGRLHEPDAVVDLGNSGTGMRLMAGWCASLPWMTVLAGDASLHSRPMGRVIEPLRKMGARIDGRASATLPPLVVHGGNLRGIHFQPPVASAQLKSAVLIAGLNADGRTTVHEPVPTRVHTEEMLTASGANIVSQENKDGSVTISVEPSVLRAYDVDVPGDPSQAAFWMVAAAIVPESDVTLENIYVGPGRNGIVEVLERMGADIELRHRNASTADIRVRYSRLRAVDVGGDEVPSLIDELPVLAIAASQAHGTSTISDAAEMRVKESDRVAAVAKEMGGLGVSIEERPDGWVIEGRPGKALSGGNVVTHLDHRIAMSGAIAGLLSSRPTIIEGWDCVDSSYPNFADDLARLTQGQSG